MRRSVSLPQFTPDPRRAVAAARRAEVEGLDGVFVYDHLWPLGRPPGTPAAECLTLLAAVAAATERVRVGTLVLRAGLRPPDVALAGFRAVAEIAPGRLVAGMGIGDAMNEPENRAFGLGVGSVDERLAAIRQVATRLMADGVEVWIGGLGRRVRELCAEVGAVWNCWALTDEQLQAALAEVPQARVTWAGLDQPPPFTVAVEEAVVARGWTEG